jgi:WD40 repeat protein
VSAIKDKNKELSKARKKRAVPSDVLAGVDAVGRLALAHSYSPHAGGAAVTALDVLPGAAVAGSAAAGAAALPSHVLSGAADGSALLLELPAGPASSAAAGGRVTARLKAGSSAGRVTSVALMSGAAAGVPEAVAACVTGSHDGVVRVWRSASGGATGDFAPAAVLRAHAGAVTGASLHPALPYVVSCARDGTWAFSDLNAGRVLYTAGGDDGTGACGSAFECGAVHPDGAIYAAGGADAVVRIFDLRDQVRVGGGWGASTPRLFSLCRPRNTLTFDLPLSIPPPLTPTLAA